MRLLFDARYIRTGFHDGISRFTAQLGAAVHELAPDEVVFLIHDLAQVAHALGVPAVVSDIAIFHEVAGPGSLYFPPKDAAAFATQVRALSDPGLRASIAEAAATQSSLFSWQRLAR